MPLIWIHERRIAQEREKKNHRVLGVRKENLIYVLLLHCPSQFVSGYILTIRQFGERLVELLTSAKWWYANWIT